MDAKHPQLPRAGIRTLRRLLVFTPPLLVLAIGGCGAGSRGDRGGAPLVSGSRGGSTAMLVGAARSAHRFAGRYGPLIYRRHLPQLPEATSAVMHQLELAAERVPPRRRALHPRPLGLALEPRGLGTLHARLSIGDGHSPVFSVGFTVARRAGHWSVVAISPPG
jgi:hypothetical protein